MLLNEIYQAPSSYQDLAQDNSSPRLEDTRKSRLTLRAIKKLRRMQDIRKVEQREKLAKLRNQYAPPAAPPA